MTADERIDALLKKAGVEGIAILHDPEADKERATVISKHYAERWDKPTVEESINGIFDVVEELIIENMKLVDQIDIMEAVIMNLVNERDNKNDTPVQ